MGGRRLTPDEIDRAADVFATTNNEAAAAEAIGVNRSTLHDAFKRLRIERNRTLHVRACEVGLRKARKRLMRIAEVAERVIDGEGVGLEPKDLAALLNAVSKNADTLAGVADREDRRRSQKLTREKTRAETELLRKKIRGEHVDRLAIEPDAREKRINELLAIARPDPADPGATE